MRLTNKQRIPVTGVPNRPLGERATEIGVAILARGLSTVAVGVLALGRGLNSMQNQSVRLGDLEPEGGPALGELELRRGSHLIKVGLGEVGVPQQSEVAAIVDAVVTDMPAPSRAVEPVPGLAA